LQGHAEHQKRVVGTGVAALKTVYAMITTNCNLNCPHCDIKTDNVDDWNAEAFISQLDANDHNIIFGGEPSLHVDRVEEAAPYCDSISTNLLYLPDHLLKLYNEKLDVATSWNVKRFTPAQYEQWLKNIQRLKRKPLLLITITPDLMNDSSFIDRVQEDFSLIFDSVSFEQLHDGAKTQEYYDAVDSWLCSLYEEWENRKIPLYCNTFHSPWYFNCDNTYTLYPNGSMKYGCPEYQKAEVPESCYSCTMAKTCRPCKLQCHCTAPKKLLTKLGICNL